MAFFGKEFNLVKQENFAELVNTFDLPQDVKDKLINSKSTTKIEKNGDTYTLSYTSAGGPKVITFKNGDEITETVREGVVTKSTFVVDGNTVTQTLKAPDNKTIVYKRVYTDNELVVTITGTDYNGEAKRYYKA